MRINTKKGKIFGIRKWKSDVKSTNSYFGNIG